ncbi:hypothetical protein AHAS_Ahas12G0185900 [Arachis hypogaea]
MPVGEVTVTLEDVLHLFGLPIDGDVVTGWIDSSHDFLVTQSLAIFGGEPQVSNSLKSYINLSWVRHIRDTQPWDTWERGSVCRGLRPFPEPSLRWLRYCWHVDGVIIHDLENGWLGLRLPLGTRSTLWKNLYSGRTSASPFLQTYTHTLTSVTQWGCWCHLSVSNGILRTEWFVSTDMHSAPWQYKPYQLKALMYGLKLQNTL